MTKIKIRSNPYNREISYLTMDEATGQWVDVRETDERSRLRETDSERSFLPFKIKEIITIIIKEYYVGREKVQLYFEGTQDEYYEVEAVCESDDVKDKIELIRTNTILENARFIKGDIKEVFERVNPVIENIMKEDFSVKRGLNKVSQALDDVIPLCVFGNYSAGKSTFINALIGVELLPSGGDLVTAKIYEIRNSEFFDQAKISFEFHGERIEISIEGKEFRVLKGDSETDIVKSIKEEIDNEGSHELYAMVRIAMDILNNYEKKDKEVTEIGSVITLVVPFSTSGVIGNSSNKFVIFDTPGSNSNSNQDHAKVLAEAMDGFSNGIPLWVTQYDAHDTKDNAELCDKVLAIDSLDNHITVLEEAHNLLRRTSNEQSAEGSNLLGKSVEMLSNAIAEMRTYGEGFIIADQAPGLMDMSVIRNTNTKIILRLPDQADRELVGRAANLNEDQITELAKLPCGVAAVYQNEWIQPVLCKVDLFAAPEKPFMFDPDDNDLDNYCKTEVEESLLNCIMEKEILRRGNKTDLKALKSKIIKSKLETCVKRDFMEYLEHDGENAIETLRKLIYDFLSAENAIIEAKQCNDIVEWTRTVVDRLNPSLRAYPNKQIDLALALILYEQTLRDVYEWRHDPAHQCSWHERCDTKTMDLVPYDIHSYCKHLGGVSECKARDSVNDGGGFDE